MLQNINVNAIANQKLQSIFAACIMYLAEGITKSFSAEPLFEKYFISIFLKVIKLL